MRGVGEASRLLSSDIVKLAVPHFIDRSTGVWFWTAFRQNHQVCIRMHARVYLICRLSL